MRKLNQSQVMKDSKMRWANIRENPLFLTVTRQEQVIMAKLRM